MERGVAVFLVILVIGGLVLAGSINWSKSEPKPPITPIISTEQKDDGIFTVIQPMKTRRDSFRQIRKIQPSSEQIKKPEIRKISPPVQLRPLQIPRPTKTGKYDISIVKKLGLTSKPVKVLVYIDPSYFRDGGFSEKLQYIRRTIKLTGARIVDASANPIVIEVPNENVLDAIGKIQWVSYIRDAEKPLTYQDTVSEGTYNISAPYAWNKGYNGNGIRVGVLDVYSGGFSNYQDLVNQGELPENTQLYQSYGTGTGVHGSACAEIVYDVAPGIDGMYLGVYNTTEQMYNVTKWFVESGVRVISHSISNFGWGPSQFDSNGDNVPEFWDVYKVIEYAIDNNVTWVNAVGNNRLEHWERNWTDQDGDGYLDIYGTPTQNGVEYDRETIQVILNSSVYDVFQAWIRWSDYPYPNSGPTNDFDAYLYCYDSGNWVLKASSENRQTGAFGQEPLEVIYLDLTSAGLADGKNHYCMLVVSKYNAPNANQMHFDVWWKGEVGYWYYSDSSYYPVVTSGSITPPSDHPSVIAVGAVGWTDITRPEGFTGEGPAYNPYLGSGTWLKPNVVAPDYVSTQTYGLHGFGGTSASAPHVAGAVADVLSASPTLTPPTIMGIIQQTAKDINATGPDYITGYGLVNVSDATPQVLTWYYPTPEGGARIDITTVTFNLTTLYKKLSQSNLTLDSVTYEMSGDSSKKQWNYTVSGLSDGEHVYNATTLDAFNVWIVRTNTKNFYVETSQKTVNEGIDGDPATGGWTSSETVAPNSSQVINGVFVWKDSNDAYTSGCTGRVYNITELQLRADPDYIYVMINISVNPAFTAGEAPAPLVGVGFDTDNNGNLDYAAYAFLDKVGVGSGTPEFLDVYNTAWNNVAANHPDAIFVAGNVIEMQIPRSVLGNPSGTIGIAGWVYEGFGGGTICSGSDRMTDNGATITPVNLEDVPMLSNTVLIGALIAVLAVVVSRRL